MRRGLSLVAVAGEHAADLAVVAGLGVALALIILPVPAQLLDALIAIDLAIGIALVMIAVYIATPIEFPAFPSVLLLATFYRLALSIAATRLILTDAHAGGIIHTFGTLAAGENLVVGVVVFLVITLVQFLVIAKGAERVGEVAARFSLDAMPGKQMSIDSDLRSGLTDKDEARRRRRNLELESQIHGSLDGAMKFIKGDAIAGIIILLINLVGGFIVGVAQRGMGVGESITTYSVLTIGEGMVAQLPALLSALAAGLVVTRTAPEGGSAHLGQIIFQQLSRHPRVLLAVAALCMLLAFVPGFPTLWFVALAVGSAMAALWLDGDLRKVALRGAAKIGLRPRAATPSLRGSAQSPVPSRVKPLHLEVVAPPPALTASVLAPLLQDLGEEIERRFGVLIPPFSFALLPDEGAAGWTLFAHEIALATGQIDGQDPGGEIRASLLSRLRRNLPGFLGLQEASDLLQRAQETHPEVVREVQRAVSTLRITDVLRCLLDEQVSLRRLPAILEALAEASQKEKETSGLLAVTRIGVQSVIVAPYTTDGELRALVLEPRLEQDLLRCIRPGSSSPQIGLGPHSAGGLISAIVATARQTNPAALVVSVELRRPLRKLIEADLFDLPVLAFNELRPPLRLSVVGHVSAELGDMENAA
jgi:type III secretion protein V